MNTQNNNTTEETSNSKQPNLTTVNGVTYYHAGKGKWFFSGQQKNGTPFTLIEKVHGRERAEKVANAIGASFKRNFNGFGLDGIGKHCVDKILAPVKLSTYKGINFSHAY